MSIDIQKLKVHVQLQEARIRALKALFRESGQPHLVPTRWSADEGRSVPGTGRLLRLARDEATLLYMLRASLRSRVHRRGMTLSDQEEAVRGRRADYQRNG